MPKSDDAELYMYTIDNDNIRFTFCTKKKRNFQPNPAKTCKYLFPQITQPAHVVKSSCHEMMKTQAYPLSASQCTIPDVMPLVTEK